jgi:hypothetical protein
MQIRLRGTEAEIDAAIAKMETLLTVFERSRPYPRGGGQFDVYVRVQL